ncbi:MAG: hypothetical protein ACJA0E_000100 [Bermanella sp.]|jgi:hypothetical protein
MKAFSMTQNIKNFAQGRKTYLAMALPLLMAAQAQSVEFKRGDVTTTLDTQLSIGSSWRAEDPDSTKVGISNEDSTDDDGNRNYDKGDAFSQIFKGSHDLHIKYKNMGVFLRGKYWYDSAIENNSVIHGHGPTATVNTAAQENFFAQPNPILESGLTNNNNQKLDDSEFDKLSKGSGATLLDAFVYGQFDIGEMPIDVRLGKQVVSWGESTFIIGGINAINPVDLSAFRRPGAEIKEGLLPVGMAYANLGVTDNLSVEAFYQYEYQNTVADPCGTYFSTSDIAAQGCNLLTVSGGALSISKDQSFEEKPSDDGQFGIALRYYADELETEFGFYAMNIHSRAPTFNVSGDTNIDYTSLATLYGSLGGNTGTDPALAGLNGLIGDVLVKPQLDPGFLASVADPGTGATFEQSYDATYPGNVGFTDAQKAADISAGLLGSAAAAGYNGALDAQVAALNLPGTVVQADRVQATNYYMEYPEDIQLFGLSFSTNVGGVALSGEVSHKIDTPVQINGPLVTNAVLARGNASAGSSDQAAAYADIFGGIDNPLNVTAPSSRAGEGVKGYRLFDITQLQFTLINTFNNVAGANQIAVVGEVGGQFIHDFDEVLRYGRASFYGNPTFAADENLDGFMTESSFGYRARASATYNSVFSGVDLIPTISWSHDVSGTSAGPGGPFLEGNQVLGLSVKAKYLERYSANLAYTMYEGGDYSITGDRDYVSASIDVQF